jgi:hypothetical protein
MQDRMRKLQENGFIEHADCLIVHTQKRVVMNVYVLRESCFSEAINLRIHCIFHVSELAS